MLVEGRGCWFEGLKSHTILGRTVLVDIVTAEEHARLVTVDESVVPTSRLSSRSIAKVLPVVRGAVAESQNVRFRVVGENLGLSDSLSKDCSLSGIAGLVDLVLVYGSLRPIVSAGRLSERAAVVLERAMRVLGLSRGWESLGSCDS